MIRKARCMIIRAHDKSLFRSPLACPTCNDGALGAGRRCRGVLGAAPGVADRLGGCGGDDAPRFVRGRCRGGRAAAWRGLRIEHGACSARSREPLRTVGRGGGPFEPGRRIDCHRRQAASVVSRWLACRRQLRAAVGGCACGNARHPTRRSAGVHAAVAGACADQRGQPAAVDPGWCLAGTSVVADAAAGRASSIHDACRGAAVTATRHGRTASAGTGTGACAVGEGCNNDPGRPCAGFFLGGPRFRPAGKGDRPGWPFPRRRDSPGFRGTHRRPRIPRPALAAPRGSGRSRRPGCGSGTG